MKVIASEDVGVAEPHAPLIIDALESMYNYSKEKKKEEYRMFFVNAVSILARAPKCRIVDNLMITLFGDIKIGKRLEMPDYAIDKHTFRGRRNGRGMKHFIKEGSKINNQGVEDPYKKRSEEHLLRKENNNSKKGPNQKSYI